MIKGGKAMEKLNISEKFTIEDIHTIRRYNSERRKKLPLKDRLEDIKKSANECEKDIEEYRKTKIAI